MIEQQTHNSMEKCIYDTLAPNMKAITRIGIEARWSCFDKIEQFGKYGKATNARNGNWRKNGISILVKPTGEKAGEYFELKPQQLGITLDKKISLSTLKKELISGVKNNKVLSDLQKQALIYAVDKINPLSDTRSEEHTSELQSH